ncbi:MAG: hypothetical protein V4584_10470 [Verrucomicrobiota bacterium]
MPSPQTLLPWLLGGAVGAAGILQGLHWRSTSTGGGLPEIEARLRAAEEENGMLRRENESLRSLAQGGGELAVPQEFRDRVEKELGLRFLSSPVMHRLASEELRDRISATVESRFGPSGIDDRQQSYQLIGWLRPDDDLLAQLTAVRAVGARGWFDDVTGEGWVTDRFDLQSIPDQAVLVRLLARILLHQHFPPAPSYPGDDAARARDALHQGAAAGVEARFYAANARSIGFMPMKPNTEAEQLMTTLSPFIRGLVGFPTSEGKGLADTLHVQSSEKLLAAFRSPPQTTRAILRPAGPAAEPLALDLPAPPEEPFLTETAGQLGLRLWLEPSGDPSAASQWKNDRYLLFPDGPESTAVLWDIEMETAAAADQLQATALRLIGRQAGREEAAALGQILVSPEKRHLLLTRPSPVRLRFLNTFEPATAAALGGR